MEKNIFKGAKFGDKFRTRNGRLALYIIHWDKHSLYAQSGFFDCLDDGTCEGKLVRIPDFDIVSRYQEPIDEKKLDELASEWCKNNVDINEDGWAEYDGNEAYKAGYRKAKEE